MSGDNRDYENDDGTIHWVPDLCEHCGNCINELPQVFNKNASPWVNIGGASKDKIVETVNLCPSGALSYTDKEILPTEEAQEE